MNVLIIGSGGREHALAWKLAQSHRIENLFCAPGNAGISEIARCVDIAADRLDNLLKWSISHQIDLVVAGPEAPLVAGIQDLFSAGGIPVFGPSRAAARLEGSKIFTKEFCRKHDIPTAPFHVCTTLEEADRAIEIRGGTCVVKADGLAAGKGVSVCHSADEARQAVVGMMKSRKFGDAGEKVIVEDLLTGEEASIMAICDGSGFLVMDSSQDHKALLPGDKGPNTGGMGAYSPAPVADDVLTRKVSERIIKPIVDGMRAAGSPFTGVLYAGVMIVDGEPFLLEINVRFGDPETQPVLMRLQSDLLEIMMKAVSGDLSGYTLRWRKDAAICVVAASTGYPGKYETGKVITGISDAREFPDVMVFHAGTKRQGDAIVTSGGRVLGVTALGATVSIARDRAYQALGKIDFDGIFFRDDIAWRAISV